MTKKDQESFVHLHRPTATRLGPRISLTRLGRLLQPKRRTKLLVKKTVKPAKGAKGEGKKRRKKRKETYYLKFCGPNVLKMWPKVHIGQKSTCRKKYFFHTNPRPFSRPY